MQPQRLRNQSCWKVRVSMADFVAVGGGFSTDFVADFATDFSKDFLADFWWIFSADFSADSSADFFANFASKPRQIFLENFPKPCKTTHLQSFLQWFSKKSPHRFSLLVGLLLYSGWTGLARQSHPPLACTFLEWLEGMPLCICLEVCWFVNPSLSTLPSTYKVQQSNSKLLYIAKQCSLADLF